MTPEDELHELLKQSADRAGTAMENDEDKSTVGTTNLYDDPEDRGKAETVDAPWGEAGTTLKGHPQADHQSDGVWEEHKKVRQGVLDRAFSGRSKADAADQALISQNFTHGAAGDFSAHSVHLQGKSIEKVSHPRRMSLMENVRKLTGRI